MLSLDSTLTLLQISNQQRADGLLFVYPSNSTKLDYCIFSITDLARNGKVHEKRTPMYKYYSGGDPKGIN